MKVLNSVVPGVSIVGPGNWGSSLLFACRDAKIPVPEIIGRSSGKLGKTAIVALSQARLNARILWLCVPDNAIQKTCEMLVAHRAKLRGQVVVHSSGALSSQILGAAANAGAIVGSVHPWMSFPTRQPVPLHRVPFAIEVSSQAARRELYAIVRQLGGEPFALEAEAKALYHAAGTMASPLLLSAVVSAQEAAVAAGLSTRQAQQLVGRIAHATMGNYLARGAGKSFSGPFARGDFQTIALHLRTLEAHPSLARVYRELASHALESLPSRNRQEIRGLLAASVGVSRREKLEGTAKKRSAENRSAKVRPARKVVNQSR